MAVAGSDIQGLLFASSGRTMHLVSRAGTGFRLPARGRQPQAAARRACLEDVEKGLPAPLPARAGTGMLRLGLRIMAAGSGSSQHEPSHEGIARVHSELAGSTAIGHAGDLGNHRRVAVGGE